MRKTALTALALFCVIMPANARARHTVPSASSGIASVYWEGQQTASGERFRPDGLTAAHRSLPLGSRVQVTNARNGRSVVVRINDRGPYVGGRIIDLSRGAARAIGVSGLGHVTLRVLS